jgi:hypothetical protein
MDTLLFYFLIIFGIYLLPKFIKYNGSSYKETSGNNFLGTVFNKGNYGEFLIYNSLERIENSKLLSNVYIPKEDGTTTEIDLIMISQTGIYIFESKNFSGWIFGNEKNKYWTQTFKNQEKHKFFNPIWQNNGHINALKKYLSLEKDVYKSYIIFSNRCTLKNITLSSPNVRLDYRSRIMRIIKNDINNAANILSINEVNNIYSKLVRNTLVSDEVKRSHINNLKSRN